MGYPSLAQTQNELEQTRAWQHLMLAGLVKGRYSGVGQPGDLFNNTAPRGPLTYSGYIIDNGRSSDTGWMTSNTIRDRNYIRFGNCTGFGSRICLDPIIDPTSVFSIDTKIDDGKPDLGLLTTIQGGYAVTYLSNCKTGSEPNSVYNISYEGAACVIQYAID
jgi:hypothetical protein